MKDILIMLAVLLLFILPVGIMKCNQPKQQDVARNKFAGSERINSYFVESFTPVEIKNSGEIRFGAGTKFSAYDTWGAWVSEDDFDKMDYEIVSEAENFKLIHYRKDNVDIAYFQIPADIWNNIFP